MARGAVEATGSVTAALGPTNTGKTHRAVERMLEHASGMIGLPLRLLAREIYDRVTRRLGESAVALVTGEEKRIPPRPRYWICTTEAMPYDRAVDFVAVDEIQLCEHPQRGHVFTHRLLHVRGKRETWLLGADTMRPLVEQLVPTALIRSFPRLSTLRFVTPHRLGGLPPRSAVVAFSVPELYRLAERVRARRGGAAVVLGALSPRTRNAQVAMYQAGEVDCLVATDAIGMGLNLAIDHVAFAELHKFDGRESRALQAAEMAQIAGRAGRHLSDGTFGTLAPAALPPPLGAAIEAHRFAAVRKLVWRSPELDFRSIDALLASLKVRPTRACFQLVERADDSAALAELGTRADVRARARDPETVTLLWEVCQIPDFRKLLVEHHAQLLAEIFGQLVGPQGRLAADWLDDQVRRLEDTSGSIDELLMRMESVRIWNYVAHRSSWLDDASHWQQRTQAAEDCLSDALHQRLVERFVERRGRTRGGGGGGATRTPHPEPRADAEAGPLASPLRRLLESGLRPKAASPLPAGGDASAWLDGLVDAPHERFAVDGAGRIVDARAPASSVDRWLGMMGRGVDLLHPEVKLQLATDPGAGGRARLMRRLLAFTRDLVAQAVEPLRDERVAELSTPGRGIVYQLEQSLGTVLAARAAAELGQLTDADRTIFAELGVELGSFVVFLPQQLDKDALARRAALCVARHGRRAAVSLEPNPPPSLPRDRRVADAAYLALGYPAIGPRAVRADLAELTFRTVRDCPPAGRGAARRELAALLGCPPGEIALLVQAFGLAGAAPEQRDERDER